MTRLVRTAAVLLTAGGIVSPSLGAALASPCAQQIDALSGR